MAGMIEVRSLGKTFVTKDASVEALQDINLSIQKGDIYGIIGMSGAGKSTLVRCLNFLERPTGGQAALAKLAALGVINSPDYWAGVVNSGKVKYLEVLLEKAADRKSVV